ncbi:MAG TPA: hypothetical protein VGR72_00475 [Candidatus Acidoferrales bacterium]|nr:hypothetical protein [Candidatus Acidoferrales bacterium]
MRSLWKSLLVLCFLTIFGSSANAGSGSPVVYVSGGALIASVNTTTGATQTLVSNPAATYEGLVVGPDNVASDNPAHPYLVYACDPTHNTIIRFDPNNLGAGIETVYTGAAALQKPQCGRFTNTGDLVVTSEVPGSGIWEFKGVANIALGAGGIPAPIQNPPRGAFSASQVSQGVAQKNIGDLLIVDAANKEVIRTQFGTIPPFSALPTVFISPSNLLPGPVGIAKKSDGGIFVSNQSKKANDIVQYSAQGTNGTLCIGFNNKTVPFFMQMSADDTLYVATSLTNSGLVYSVNTATCTATAVPNTSLPPLVGIALPPTTVTQTATFSGTQTFNFGFAAYQFTSTSCTLSVAANALNQAQVNALIALDVAADFNGAMPSVDLGRDGFETAFDLTPTNCAPDSAGDGLNAQLIAVQVDSSAFSNPRMLACDPTIGPTNCTVANSFGDYPLGGILPADPSIILRGSGSRHFVVNGNLSQAEAGIFCGFQSPLTNAVPPALAGTFGSGQNLSVKFKLAQASGNCQNGPFIDDALALLSIARIFDANGAPVFNPVAIGSSGSSTPVPPTFKVNGTKHQYEFSLTLQGYAAGTYSLTVTFLTNNTVQQTIEIKVQ